MVNVSLTIIIYFILSYTSITALKSCIKSLSSPLLHTPNIHKSIISTRSMGNILTKCYSSVKARVIIIGDSEQCKTLYHHFTGIEAVQNEHYEHLIKRNKITLALPFVATHMWKVHIQHADGVIFVGDLEGFNEYREFFEVCKCMVLFVNNGNKEVVIDDCNLTVTNAFGEVDRMVTGCEGLFTKLLK